MEYALPETTIGVKWKCVWNGNIYLIFFLLFRHKKKPVIGNDAPIKPAIKTIILPQIPNMLPV